MKMKWKMVINITCDICVNKNSAVKGFDFLRQINREENRRSPVLTLNAFMARGLDVSRGFREAPEAGS